LRGLEEAIDVAWRHVAIGGNLGHGGLAVAVVLDPGHGGLEDAVAGVCLIVHPYTLPGFD
jgi:hypothetical protein